MSVIRAVLFAVFAAAAGWLCLVAGQHLAAYYARLLETQATAALAVLDLGWAEVATDGLSVSLAGHAPDPYAQELAYETLRLVLPGARIEDRSSATLPPPPVMPPPEVEMHRTGLAVRLSGTLADRALAAGLRRAIAEEAPRIRVSEDLVRLGARAAAGPMPFALAAHALGAVPAARIALMPGRLSVTGVAESEEARAALMARLFEEADPDLRVEIDLHVPPPVISPFAFSAVSSGDGLLRLERCAARTVEEASALEGRLAREGLRDHAGRCRVGLGGPLGDWLGAVDRGLTALGELPSGRLVVHDRRLSVFAEAGAGRAALEAAAKLLAEGLPPGFVADLVPGEVALPETDESVFTERFWLSLTVNRASVVLAGQMDDPAAVEKLETFAAVRFPGSLLRSSIAISPRPAPPAWSEMALAVLEGLAASGAGHAELVPERLIFEADIVHPSLARRLHGALSDALPEVSVTTRFGLDLPAQVDAVPLTGERCALMLNSLVTQRPIRFAPGSAVLTRSARESLDRVAELMRRCPESVLEIGGHTDSQGSAELNRRLSKARAETVLAALEARAIPSQRMTAVGYGEDHPIASNATPIGRSRNRRIAFVARGEGSGRDIGAAVAASGGGE